MLPLQHALASLHIEQALVAQTAYADPWDLSLPAGASRFAYIVSGTAQSNHVLLQPGDLLLVSPAQELVLSGAPGCILLRGRMTVSAPWVLPPFLHVNVPSDRPDGLRTALEMLATETVRGGPASELLTQQWLVLALMYVLREHALQGDSAWMGALADPSIGPAIRRMQQAIDQPWTVAGLAAEAGMSRSVFAQRFKDLTGSGPWEFLTQQRMQQATRLLRQQNRKLTDVAHSIGYTSDGAFHRAFRRVIGMSPGEYRRAQL